MSTLTTLTKENPMKRKFCQSTLHSAPTATPNKREFVETTPTMTGPMAPPTTENDFVETFR